MPRVRSAPHPTGAGPVECFPNPQTARDYQIRVVTREFTTLCPRTAQPDFGMLTITYVPGRRCLELKSLKLYLQSYRNRGIFYEAATNQVLDDLVRSCAPRSLTIVGEFNTRGGLTTTVTATYPGSKGRRRRARR